MKTQDLVHEEQYSQQVNVSNFETSVTENKPIKAGRVRQNFLSEVVDLEAIHQRQVSILADVVKSLKKTLKSTQTPEQKIKNIAQTIEQQQELPPIKYRLTSHQHDDEAQLLSQSARMDPESVALTLEVNEWKDKVRSKNQEIQDLKASLQAQINEVQMLKKSRIYMLESQCIRIDHLQPYEKEKEQTEKQHQHQLEQQAALYHKLDQECKLTKEELKKQLKLSQEQATRLQFQIGGLEEHLADAKNTIVQLHQKVKELTQENGSLTNSNKHENSQQSIQTLSQIAQKECKHQQTITNLESTIRELEKKLSRTQEKAQMIKRENEWKTKMMEQRQAQLKRQLQLMVLSQQQHQLKLTSSTIQNEELIKKYKKMLEKSKSDRAAESAKYERNEDLLSNKIQSLKREIQTYEKAINDLRENEGRAQSQHAKTIQKYEAVLKIKDTQIQELESKAAQQRQKLKAKICQNDELRQKNVSLQNRLEVIKQQCNSEINESNSKINSFERRHNQDKNQMSALQLSLGDYKQREKDNITYIKQLQEKLAILEDQKQKEKDSTYVKQLQEKLAMRKDQVKRCLKKIKELEQQSGAEGNEGNISDLNKSLHSIKGQIGKPERQKQHIEQFFKTLVAYRNQVKNEAEIQSFRHSIAYILTSR